MTTSTGLDPTQHDEQRAAALAAGAPKVPRRAVAWGFAAAAVLALGGTLLERVLTSAGLNPGGAAPTTTLRVTAPSVPLGLPASTLLGLERFPRSPAPSISLTTQSGQYRSLAALRGDVVVVSFFNATCTDQCRVIADELARADQRLGSRRDRVAILTVNTDRLELGARPLGAAITTSALRDDPNWSFLTGPLPRINAVWKAYDVAVDVYPSARLVVHTEPLWVIAPNGDLTLRASPLILESRTGSYSLPGVLVRRAGDALAVQLLEVLGTGT